MTWLLLVLSLPTENATARMRAWRALKTGGAAVLRDGVYLLPDRDGHEPMLEAIADDVRAAGGSAELLKVVAEPADRFESRFDRGAEFGALIGRVTELHAALDDDEANAAEVLKQAMRLRKGFDALAAIDFFPGEAQLQADAALDDLDSAARQRLAPDEPHAVASAIEQRRASEFRGRVWATRRRPWVDRLASAWLIRRFIDRKARFLWLDAPKNCPRSAVGFDFDGATFSHVGAKVTFETLLASFGLEQPGLRRIGAIVHHLDAGGVPAPESQGIERVLAGLRESIGDDDKLLAAACAVFDALLAAFDAEVMSP